VELMDMAEISVSRVPCNSEQGAWWECTNAFTYYSTNLLLTTID
jgi:hypothetical protein